MSTLSGQHARSEVPGRGPQRSDPGGRFLRPIRRESKVTVGGLVYIGVTVFLAIGAINSQNNLLFWLFGVAIATLVVSGLFSGSALMRLRLIAHTPADATAGTPMCLTYTLGNRSRFFPLFAATIAEFPDENTLVTEAEPAGVMHLAPLQSASFSGMIVPRQRGRYTLGTIRLSTRFPFGLLRKSLIFDSPRTLLVLPYALEIRPGLVRASPGYGQQVRRRTASPGASNEYWGLREYRPGDASKRIAWKHSARRSGLVVVENAPPLATRLWVWLTGVLGEDVVDEAARERAIALAAALLRQGVGAGMPVALWAPEQGLKIGTGSGTRHLGRCLGALATIDASRAPLPDVAPPLGGRDRVVGVSPTGRLPGPVSGSGRGLSVASPGEWLCDPSSLPRALGGEA